MPPSPPATIRWALPPSTSPSTPPSLPPTQGAHHIDLMFSDPADTPDILAVRQAELEAIRGWISQYSRRRLAVAE